MSASYEITPYVTSAPKYRVAGVGKVRFRGEHLWCWDPDGNVLLVTLFQNLRIVQRVDIDASSADEDVVELIEINAPSVHTAPVVGRIPGVASIELKIAETYTYSRAFTLNSDDDDLPAALVNARWYSLRRQGTAFAEVP